MYEILLVEDSDSDAESMERALRQERVTNPVVRLVDGAKAIEYFNRVDQAVESGAQAPPSVLLLDL